MVEVGIPLLATGCKPASPQVELQQAGAQIVVVAMSPVELQLAEVPARMVME